MLSGPFQCHQTSVSRGDARTGSPPNPACIGILSRMQPSPRCHIDKTWFLSPLEQEAEKKIAAFKSINLNVILHGIIFRRWRLLSPPPSKSHSPAPTNTDKFHAFSLCATTERDCLDIRYTCAFWHRNVTKINCQIVWIYCFVYCCVL